MWRTNIINRDSNTSESIGKSACPACRAEGNDRTGDNLVEFDDGHSHCFACGYRIESSGESRKSNKDITSTEVVDFNALGGEYQDIPSRRISRGTCEQFGYRVATSAKGNTIHVSDYRLDGALVAQKVRSVDTKDFRSVGSLKRAPLFGGHLWAHGGKRIVVTEGELDCLSIAEMQNGRFPVVSVPSGAAGAAKAIRSNLEFLNSYDSVVFCFDSDEAGREAAKKCADLVRPGKAHVATLPLKDANEMLVARRTEELNKALWEARLYSPDGILPVSEVEHNDKGAGQVWAFPWDSLTDYLIGQRSGEMTLWTSGTGSGKSTIIRELVNHHLEEGRRVGMVMLEESPAETVDDLVSLRINKQVRRIRANRELNNLRLRLGKAVSEYTDDLSEEEYDLARTSLNETELFVYDSHGIADFESLFNRVEFMATALDCDVIVLDHITAAVAGMAFGDDGMNSERLVIDDLMKRLRSLVERSGCHLDVISQLRKSSGRGYEEGERISIQDLRGSGSLASVPNTVIAMERNRQHPDDETANTSVLRVLKNRFNGVTGVASAVRYCADSGRLNEVDFAHADDGEVLFGESL